MQTKVPELDLVKSHASSSGLHMAVGQGHGEDLEKIKIAPFGAQTIFIFLEFHTPSGNQRPVERAQWCDLTTDLPERIVSGHCPQRNDPWSFVSQDQGSSVDDGIIHLRNLLLSIDLFLGSLLSTLDSLLFCIFIITPVRRNCKMGCSIRIGVKSWRKWEWTGENRCGMIFMLGGFYKEAARFRLVGQVGLEPICQFEFL